MTSRERAVFAALCDAVVSPAGAMPPVAGTDAVAAFEKLLARSPRVNALGLRGGLRALDRAPIVMRRGSSLRALPRQGRLEVLERLARSPLGGVVNGLRALAHLSYYGDAAVMRAQGFDPAALVARGRALREAEARW